VTDDTYFEKAWQEYRETTGSTLDFAELPNDIQVAILWWARLLKERDE
jgi:hypothetical protein